MFVYLLSNRTYYLRLQEHCLLKEQCKSLAKDIFCKVCINKLTYGVQQGNTLSSKLFNAYTGTNVLIIFNV